MKKNCKNKNVCKHYNYHINVGATTETGFEVNVIVTLSGEASQNDGQNRH